MYTCLLSPPVHARVPCLQCHSVYCQPGSEGRSQRVEIVSSVHFVDASKRAASESAAAPIIADVSVPDDFFYPFS